MKVTILTVMTVVLASLVACSMSSRGGDTPKEEGFRILVPAFDKSVKQGEVRTVDLSLARGDYFKQDVRLEIRASKGIDVQPAEVLVKGSDRPDVQLRISAPPNAPLGEYRVNVKGTPQTGEQASAEFQVRVVAP